MLEAGFLVTSQEHQWRPMRLAAGESRTKTVGLVGGRRLGLVETRSWWNAEKQDLALADELGMLSKFAGCDRGRQRFGSPRSWRADNAHTVVWTGHRSSHEGWWFDSSWPKQHQLLGYPGLDRPAMVFWHRSRWIREESRAPTRFDARESRRRSEGRKPGAWEWRVPAGARDNKSAAETGARHRARRTGGVTTTLSAAEIAGLDSSQP